MIRNYEPSKKRATLLGVAVLAAAALIVLPSAFASGKDGKAVPAPSPAPSQSANAGASGLPSQTAAIKAGDAERIDFAMPTSGEVKLSSTFGYRVHPVDKSKQLHDGIDIVGQEGADVFAAASGEVVAAGYDKVGGNRIVVRHDEHWSTEYRHLSAMSVKEGDAVKAGEAIGQIGSTGQTTGPHLHFSVMKDGAYIDPASVIGGDTSDR